MEVQNIKLAHQDARGYTYEVNLLADGREGPFVVCNRKAGSVCGEHYHRGLVGKNPEVVYLLSGSVCLECMRIDESMAPSTLSKSTIQAPARITINPLIWHKMTVLEDATFFELNTLSQGSDDTTRLLLTNSIVTNDESP